MIVRHSKKSFLSSRVLLILLIICAAFVSAFLGQMTINLLTASPTLLSEQPLIVRQGQDMFAMLHNLSNDVKAREADGFVQLYTQQIDNVSAPVSQGIILTTDGWILTTKQAGSPRWQWLRLDSGELLPVTAIVNDPSTPLQFIKAEASSLQPVTLADRLDASTWGPKLALGYGANDALVMINGLQPRADAYLSSDLLNTFYGITGGEEGQAVYNEKAEIIGLIAHVNEEPVLVEVAHIREAMGHVLRAGEIRRASLGVRYLDLADRAYSENVNGGLTSGALLTNAIQAPQPTTLPVSSLAYRSGLRLQDVIVSVDGLPVNHVRGLSDLILAADPGDTLELGILRAGNTITFRVTLGEIVSE